MVEACCPKRKLRLCCVSVPDHCISSVSEKFRVAAGGAKYQETRSHWRLYLSPEEVQSWSLTAAGTAVASHWVFIYAGPSIHSWYYSG